MFARISLKLAASPEAVADAFVEGVRSGRFYILTDHEWDKLIQDRAAKLFFARRLLPPGAESPQARAPLAR